MFLKNFIMTHTVTKVEFHLNNWKIFIKNGDNIVLLFIFFIKIHSKTNFKNINWDSSIFREVKALEKLVIFSKIYGSSLSSALLSL